MKTIYIIGFRGTGPRDQRYFDELPLIRVGHVGFAFEDDPNLILGFRPIPEIAEQIGDADTVIAQLRNGLSIQGRLYADYDVFLRAWQISRHDERTTVWQLAVPFPDAEYERIYHQGMEWYTEGVEFTYSFPQKNPNVDNCATFPRHLGIPLPELTGHLSLYVQVLRERGSVGLPVRWMMNPTVTQIHDELLDVLERKLNELAYEWRSSKSDDAVRDYQAVLRCMIEMGYRDALDADAELPDEFLPAEYLALHA